MSFVLRVKHRKGLYRSASPNHRFLGEVVHEVELSLTCGLPNHCGSPEYRLYVPSFLGFARSGVAGTERARIRSQSHSF